MASPTPVPRGLLAHGGEPRPVEVRPRRGWRPRTRTSGSEQMARIVKAHILSEDADGVGPAGRWDG